MLTYYPPYQSKYNAIERCWGILEKHWSGELFDSSKAVIGFASSMTNNACLAHPINPCRMLARSFRKGDRS